MNMLTQVSCNVQGNTWLQVGDYNHCLTQDNVHVALAVFAAMAVIILIMLVQLTIKDYQIMRLKRTIAAMAMEQGE